MGRRAFGLIEQTCRRQLGSEVSAEYLLVVWRSASVVAEDVCATLKTCQR